MPFGLEEEIIAALIGLGGGMLLGLAARLGRFCTLGAVEDLIYGQDDTRMRMWALSLGLATTGVFVAAALGWVAPGAVFYNTESWSPVLAIAGGLIFGYGMALAGSCGYGALARLGGGDLRAYVIILVLGITAYFVLSGPAAPLRVWALEATALAPGDGPGIAGWLAQRTGLGAAAIGIVIGLAIAAAALLGGTLRQKPVLMISALTVAVAIVTGFLGTAWLAEVGFSGQAVLSHTYSAPIGETLLWGMTASGGGLSFAVGSVLGVPLGAVIGSLAKREFRWEACEDPRELRRQLVGAALMGVGAVLAVGCSVGQGISAFAVLAWSAPLVVASIIAGAALGLRQLITGFQPAE